MSRASYLVEEFLSSNLNSKNFIDKILEKEEGEWKTIKGNAVLVGDDGNILIGPKAIKDLKSKKDKEGDSNSNSSTKRKQRDHLKSFETEKEMYDQTLKDFKDNGKEISYKEAKEISDSVSEFTSKDYEAIRSNDPKYEKARKNIENYIANAPTFSGEVYRGIKINIDQLPKEGETINMKGISSWSSDKDMAENYTDRGENRVIFRTKSKSGVSISHLSNIPQEKEIIFSKQSKFKINKINKEVVKYKVRGITKKKTIVWVDVDEE